MYQKVSAVIPTYNGQRLLAAHLPSVLDCLRDDDELIIVDDASHDSTVDWLTKQFIPQAEAGKKKIEIVVVVNKTNLRFGAAVNRGVERASGELILLLNNDVKPHPDILKHLLPHFQTEEVFAVGCLELEKDDSAQVIKGGKNKLWFERGMFIHSRANNFSSGKTAWVSGGSGLYNRTKWLDLGGFDSAFYPAYWEDIDLSFRARQHGWQIEFEAKAIVEHIHETTHQAVFGQSQIEAISWKNANKFVWKNGSLWQKFQYLLWKPYWLIKRGQL